MTKRLLSFLPFLLAAMLLGACSDFQKISKSDNVDNKYQAALKYYEEKEYMKADALLNDLMPLLKGRSEYEQAQFTYAYTKFHQHLYLESSFHFTTFVETFPRSQYAEEAAYMNAKSLFYESPSYNLDQQSTAKAMTAIQEFLRRYPQSKYLTEANDIYNQLSLKIERKAFDNAKVYYNLRFYQSAVVALENFRKSYPSSPLVEEAAFLRLESQYNYAKESIESKQEERYSEVVAMYQGFIDTYPQSKFLRTAEGYYENSVAAIKKIKASAAANATAASNK